MMVECFDLYADPIFPDGLDWDLDPYPEERDWKDDNAVFSRMPVEQ